MRLIDADRLKAVIDKNFVPSIAKMLKNYVDIQPTADAWISVQKSLPDEFDEVEITFVNRNPESYYADIKDVPQTGFAVYYNDEWYWWTPIVVDMLKEYGRYEAAEIDPDIEVTAWKPKSEPYKEKSKNE